LAAAGNASGEREKYLLILLPLTTLFSVSLFSSDDMMCGKLTHTLEADADWPNECFLFKQQKTAGCEAPAVGIPILP